MTKAASEKELAGLHSKLAKVLINALDSSSTSEYLLDKFSGELPEEVTEYLEGQTTFNPALLQAASKFLKDNEITCQPNENEEMSDLQKMLAHKRKVIKIDGIDTIEKAMQ